MTMDSTRDDDGLKEIQAFEALESADADADADDNILAEKQSNNPYTQEPSFTYKEHLSQIFVITGPIVISEIFQNTLPIVDLAFVGNLPDKNNLAAAALATVWFNLWNATMLGFMTAIDTMLAQSFGAGELSLFSMWTGNSIVIVTLVTIVISGFVALCEPFMVLFGQDPDIAKAAGEFSYRLIPGLIPYFVFKVLTKYLQTQNRVAPSVYIGLLANGFNVLVNWLFIYELDMGLNGAPWATTLTRFIEMIIIISYIYWKKQDLSETMPTFALKNLKFKVVKLFLKLAVSGALSFACEAWSFEITTILAGLISTVALDAHVVTLSIATFIYLSFPFAVGIATSIRVGQLIGEGKPADAKRSCKVAYGINFLVEVVLIIIVLPCSKLLGDLFSRDEEVAALITKLIPLSCIFMLGDAFQANTGGAMRGLGRQKLVLLLNILGFWALAIPIGITIAFATNIGVAGLWWGFSIGIYSAAFIGIFFLRYRVNWEKEATKANLRISTLRS
jgi:MATE family multidrug resistance protein